MSVKGKIVAGAASLALLVGAGVAGHQIDQPSTLSPIEAQRAACPETTSGIEPKLAPEPTPNPDCVAALQPPQLLLPQTLGPLTAYANGQFPASAISPATGCSIGLANSAAAAWNHVAVIVHDHTGYWLQSNGSVSCYRTYQQQVDLRNQWCAAGNCSNAAVPGTSNHGWGIAVDAPPQTVSYIHQYSGGLWGQGYGSCSDAPWESWHVKYCGGYSGPDPGAYGSGGGGGHHFKTLKLGDKGPRVGKLTTHLAVLHNLGEKGSHRYLSWDKRSKVYTRSVKHAVRRLQHDGKLTTDGVYGPKTAAYQANRWHYYCKKHHGKKVC